MSKNDWKRPASWRHTLLRVGIGKQCLPVRQQGPEETRNVNVGHHSFPKRRVITPMPTSDAAANAGDLAA
jgi:hypothetical protein